MCEPMTIMAGIGAGLSLLQQQDQADQMNAAADRQEKAINESTVASYEQLNRQATENAQNASVEGVKLSREVATRTATARAQNGASGVSGLSVDAMLLDLAGKGLEAQTSADTNYARQVAATNDQFSEIQRGAKGQLGSIQRSAGVTGLDVLGAGLKVGTAYAGSEHYKASKGVKKAVP